MDSTTGGTAAADARPLVRMRNASKRFGATQALDGVDLELHAGSILALLGQNGAGKSTVIKVLADIYTLDSGEVEVCGVHPGSAEVAGRISFIHQDLGLVPGLTVAENVSLGTGYPRRRGLIDWRAGRRRAEQAMALVGADIDPRARIADLSRTERSLVAIGRALAVDAKVLVLDEPTASLPVDETDRLFTVLRSLRDRGLGLIYVSHRLDEVFELADHATIMRDGRIVADAALTELSPDDVVQHIVGKRPVPPPPPTSRTGGTAVLEVSDLVGQGVGPVSLTVGPGEVVGLVGLSGAGHVELGRTLLGDLRCFAGAISLRGESYVPSTVAAAVARGFGFVTSNRADEGLAMSLTLTENLRPNPHVNHERGWRNNRRERATARQLIETYGVRPADPDLLVAALSGGNQQKIILGRWLSTEADVLILEEPTAGVDVGAKHELYRLLDSELERGIGVLLISTDFEEVAKVCHRALVFRDGLTVREIGRDELSVSALVSHASGSAA